MFYLCYIQGLLIYIYYRLWTWYIRTRFVMHQVLLNSWRVLTPDISVTASCISWSNAFLRSVYTLIQIHTHPKDTALYKASYTSYIAPYTPHTELYIQLHTQLHTHLTDSSMHPSHIAPYTPHTRTLYRSIHSSTQLTPQLHPHLIHRYIIFTVTCTPHTQ